MNETFERLPALVFLILFAALWLLEGVLPARPRQADAPRRWRNLFFTVANFTLGGLGAATMLAASMKISEVKWGLTARPPTALTIALGVLLLDLADYWRHRLSHQWAPLWRLHRLHHTDARIDLTTALRSHPCEQLLRLLILAVAIVALGIPPLAVLVHPLLVLPVLLLQHANVRLPKRLERALVWLVSTPAMHLVHHSRRANETDSNYATALTVWDRVFGTWSSCDAPQAIGLDGFDEPRQQTLGGMLRNPWQRTTARRR